MAITLRPSKSRGHANHGWLDSYHSFSFADYYDPKHMSFRSLRVINEDRVAGAEGFGTHPHKNMEILTYVIEGQLEHEDSMGHKATIEPGEIQKISAGTGIAHSEYNASKTDTVHLLQIWIIPNKQNITPSYQQVSMKNFNQNGLNLFASPQGGEGIIKMEQDVNVFRGFLTREHTADFALRKARGAWVQMISGKLELNGHELMAGDGAAIEEVEQLEFKTHETSEFLLFDLV
jgi:redox-sensitive bicupin YhaK (pirin superfamily)